MAFPLPLLDYKKTPGHPYHITTSLKPSPPYFHCRESTKLLLCLPILSSHLVSLPSLVLDDLSTKILHTFSSRCTPMYPNNISKNRSKRNPDATRNVISVQTAASQHCLFLVLRSLDQVVFNLLHVVKVVFHTYHYLCAMLVYITITNLREHSRLFHTVSTQPTIYDLLSIIAPIDYHRRIFIPHHFLGFIFKTLRKSLELF
jgi:hypothetical protein